MIRYDNLQVGDIVSTTSSSPIAMIIKWKLFGFDCILRGNLPNHSGMIVKRNMDTSLLYVGEMGPKGPVYTELDDYDHKHPRNHFVRITRHPLMCPVKQKVVNDNFMLLHEMKVRYGFEDLLRFITKKVKDNANTIICSEMVALLLEKADILYPKKWDFEVSPKDIFAWRDVVDITDTILK